MRVITIVRTRDDADIIERFVMAYQEIADLIIIADGGSTDYTAEIAERLPKTKVLHFDKRLPVDNNLWINPQGEHLNFLIDQAIAEGADWIIFDDSDCVPNFILKWQAKERFELATIRGQDAIFLRRVYFWGDHQIFPNLHKTDTSIWAWRSHVPIQGDTEKRHLKVMGVPEVMENAMHLEFPYCLLHYPWPTPEAAEAKMRWYRETGVQPAALHPLEWGGPLEDADWFMYEHPPEIERSDHDASFGNHVSEIGNEYADPDDRWAEAHPG